jgi:hypothetical protein
MKLAKRSHGIIVTASIACAALMLPAVALAASTRPATPATPTGPASAPQCRSSNIEVWLGLNPDGAALGTTWYPLEFTNDGFRTRTCWLKGSPGLIAVNGSGRRIGPAVAASTSGPRITLKPGQTAYARIGIVQAGFINGCQQATGAGLEVTPPGQTASQPIDSFTFQACKNKTFMYAQKLQAGVGIP